jgi:hypothetical protein
MALTKEDLNAVRSVVREETKGLTTKENLAATESHLGQKIESKIEGRRPGQ